MKAIFSCIVTPSNGLNYSKGLRKIKHVVSYSYYCYFHYKPVTFHLLICMGSTSYHKCVCACFATKNPLLFISRSHYAQDVRYPLLIFCCYSPNMMISSAWPITYASLYYNHWCFRQSRIIQNKNYGWSQTLMIIEDYHHQLSNWQEFRLYAHEVCLLLWNMNAARYVWACLHVLAFKVGKNKPFKR